MVLAISLENTDQRAIEVGTERGSEDGQEEEANEIDIPRPRFDYARSSIFFEHVDRIEDILEKAGIENIEHV